jgi:hypothetical protein
MQEPGRMHGEASKRQAKGKEEASKRQARGKQEARKRHAKKRERKKNSQQHFKTLGKHINFPKHQKFQI